jgi:hypothetical protein
VAGQNYYVQYSSNLTNWTTVLPAVTGTGTRQQWIDNGPPKTESFPSGVMRAYRLRLAP